MKSTSLSIRNRPIIAVIGGHKCSSKVEQNAHYLGILLAKMGANVVCGGLGGVMESVSRGVHEEGGLVIGILPGESKRDANRYVDIPIATGLGFTRNTIVVGCADIVIALPGEYGTLSEISFALNMKKPVISLASWSIKGVKRAKTPKHAVDLVLKIMKKKKSE